MALTFNYKKDKTKSEWMFVNFLTIQTVCIIIYFSIGLPYYYKWMKQNDAVIYSFFIGGFLAMVGMWLHELMLPQKAYASMLNFFRTKKRAKK